MKDMRSSTRQADGTSPTCELMLTIVQIFHAGSCRHRAATILSGDVNKPELAPMVELAKQVLYKGVTLKVASTGAVAYNMVGTIHDRTSPHGHRWLPFLEVNAGQTRRCMRCAVGKCRRPVACGAHVMIQANPRDSAVRCYPDTVALDMKCRSKHMLTHTAEFAKCAPTHVVICCNACHVRCLVTQYM